MGKRNGLVTMLRTIRGEGSIESGRGREEDIPLVIKQEPLKRKNKVRNLCLYYDGEKKIVFPGNVEAAYRLKPAGR